VNRYLTADYDRSQFTVSPCVWPSTFTQDLHAIYQPNSTLAQTTQSTKASTPIGAIVGGVVGGIVVLGLAFILLWFCYLKPRRKRRKAAELEAIAAGENSSQLPNSTLNLEPSELDPTSEFRGVELSAYEEAEKKRRAEAEMAGTPILGHEMDSHTPVGSELGATEIFEMPAREPVGSEMGTPVHSPLASPRSGEASPMLSSGWNSPAGGARSPLRRGISVLGEGEEGAVDAEEQKRKRFSFE
jgi:hypothetical protein